MTRSSASSPGESHRGVAAHERFSGVVQAYANFRPDYPSDLLDQLMAATGLTAGQDVADIGAGTGIFTQMLLAYGLRVWAVEPSLPMLAEARTRLQGCVAFRPVNGSAEASTLASASVDAIFCAQAFHWFNAGSALVEWRRILRPNGWAVLVWNNLDLRADFERQYLDLMRRGSVDAGHTIDLCARVQSEPVVFEPGTATRLSVNHRQTLDLAGLVGRTESASYAPKAGDSRHQRMIAELRSLFGRYQSDGAVTLRYETVAILGRLRTSTPEARF